MHVNVSLGRRRLHRHRALRRRQLRELGFTPDAFSATKSAEPHELKPTLYLKPVASHMSASANAVSER